MAEQATREPIIPSYIAWGDPITDPTTVGQLHFDAVLVEEHELTAEVTQHTVEQGSPIVDHVRPNPDEVTLTVFVSNTPIRSPDGQVLPLTLALDPPGPSGLLAGGTSGLIGKGLQAIGLQDGFPSAITPNVLQFIGETDYVQNALKTLTQLRDTATLLSVVTPRKFYSNMVVRRIAMHRDAGTGTGAQFELSFLEVRIVSSNIVDAPLPTIAKAAPTVDKGKLDPTAASAPKQSVALKNALNSGVQVGNGPASNAIGP